MIRPFVASILALGALGAGPALAADPPMRSSLDTLVATELGELPEGPHPAQPQDNCNSTMIAPTTDAGRYVAGHGWGVISEISLGQYQLVSFGGEFIGGTSGSCAVAQGNVGVFAGGKLKGLVYTKGKADRLIGQLVGKADGTVRLWGSDFLPLPVADLSASRGKLIVGPVAPIDVLCDGAAKVPNIFDQPILEARKALQSAGWKPVPQQPEEGDFATQPDLIAAGVVETETCSGTGFGYCSYAYESPAGTLSVTSVGELYDGNVPQVVGYDVSCR